MTRHTFKAITKDGRAVDITVEDPHNSDVSAIKTDLLISLSSGMEISPEPQGTMWGIDALRVWVMLVGVVLIGGVFLDMAELVNLSRHVFGSNLPLYAMVPRILILLLPAVFLIFYLFHRQDCRGK